MPQLHLDDVHPPGTLSLTQFGDEATQEAFAESVERLLRETNTDIAAATLEGYLADERFVEFLCGGAWGDDQVPVARLMRAAAMADVLLAHPDEGLRSQAANWLSHIEDESARLVLIATAADDEMDLVRAGAAEALADHRPHPTLSAIALHLLADADVLVRGLAVYGAMQQGLEPEVRELLLSEPEDRVLVRVHSVLAGEGDEASSAELYSLLAHSDYVVRCNAMDGLAGSDGHRGSPRFHRAVMELAARDAARAVSSRAQEICRELGLTPQRPSPGGK